VLVTGLPCDGRGATDVACIPAIHQHENAKVTWKSGTSFAPSDKGFCGHQLGMRYLSPALYLKIAKLSDPGLDVKVAAAICAIVPPPWIGGLSRDATFAAVFNHLQSNRRPFSLWSRRFYGTR